jgi:hypothetical protein
MLSFAEFIVAAQRWADEGVPSDLSLKEVKEGWWAVERVARALKERLDKASIAEIVASLDA